jgi:hypothetical protein
MVGNGEELSKKMIEEIQRVTDEELTQPVWPGRSKAERGTTAYKTTWVRQNMSLGMALP